MHSILRFSILLAILWQGANATEYFPETGRHDAICYTVGGSDRVEAISKKMGVGIAKNREWFEAYLKKLNLKPGELLPYHENLGITREEYDFFIGNIKKLILVKFADAVVDVRSDQGGVKLRITGVNLPVSEYEFSMDGAQLKCAYGIAKDMSDFDQTDPDSTMGRWKGRSWKIQEGEADPTSLQDYLTFQFAIGRDESGRRLIYIRSSGLKNKVPNNWGCIIRWQATAQ